MGLGWQGLLGAVLVTAVGMGATREAAAAPTTFEAGSFIIPMDTAASGQNAGMLRAYGLVYALLRSGVAVHWAIAPAKTANGDDFTITPGSLTDAETGAAIALPRTYRGGPFVVADTDAAAASPIIQAWLATAGDATTVHLLVSGSFSAEVSRTLVAAPRLALLKDGNETIAMNDLNAAGIPDATGAAWSASSPDLLTEADVAGPTTVSHTDGALLIGSLPRYCQLTSIHYNTTASTPEVVQEVRAWLDSSSLTHGFMQCESTRVFENAVGGLFLTNAGLDDDGSPTTTPTIRVPADPHAQIDGAFEVDSGAVDSFRANDAPGATPDYKTGVTTLINEQSAPLTSRIVLLTGRLDGDGSNGRVTYLGGHDYSTDLPISSNPQTNGVRLYLDSIFAADCGTTLDDPDVTLVETAPSSTQGTTIAYTIAYENPGSRAAENLVLTATIPAGATFTNGSASDGGSHANGVVTWTIPPLAPGANGSRTFSATVAADGTYISIARLTFSNLNVRTVSDDATTIRDTVLPTDAPTPTATLSATPTPAETQSATPTDFATATATDSPTPTETPIPTETPTPPTQPSASAGGTPSPTASATPSAQPTCAPPDPGPTATPITSGARKCQRGIAKSASKFLAARTKALQSCAEKVVKGTIPGPCPDLAASKKIATANAKLTSAIGKVCGGADKVCGSNLTNEEPPAGLGWPATCPSFLHDADPGCSAPIADCGDIAACVGCVGAAAVEQAIDLAYGDLVPSNAKTALNKCQRAIGKAAAAFTLARDKSVQKCWDLRLAGKHRGLCPDAAAAAKSPAQKSALAIAKAEAKKIAAICKACGGADKRCDDAVTTLAGSTIAGSGNGDDLAPTAIGFPAFCPAVQIPGGTSCAQPVGSLAALVECVDCMGAFESVCVDRLRVPELVPYPCECNP